MTGAFVRFLSCAQCGGHRVGQQPMAKEYAFLHEWDADAPQDAGSVCESER
jgi:hypothetical protein